MTNGFGKLLFQNHNGSMRITRSPFIRSFIRIFITGKTCSYMYTTSALHNLKVSRAEISTVFFYFLWRDIFRYSYRTIRLWKELMWDMLNFLWMLSCIFNLPLYVYDVFSSFFFLVNNKIYFRMEESDIFSYRGFLVPNVMKNEVER